MDLELGVFPHLHLPDLYGRKDTCVCRNVLPQAAQVTQGIVLGLQVKCCECGYESNTREGFFDISLEITRAATLARALQQFTRPEHLDAENKYRCPKEARLVRAVKRISIERPPNVLVIQLKRFEYARHGSKITKKARARIPSP